MISRGSIVMIRSKISFFSFSHSSHTSSHRLHHSRIDRRHSTSCSSATHHRHHVLDGIEHTRWWLNTKVDTSNTSCVCLEKVWFVHDGEFMREGTQKPIEKWCCFGILLTDADEHRVEYGMIWCLS